MSDLTPSARAERERIVKLLTQKRDQMLVCARIYSTAGDIADAAHERGRARAIEEAIAAIQGDDNAG